MGSFLINGGRRLSGEIRVDSAKNSLLPLLAASILTKKDVTLKKCPDISDVGSMLSILKNLGCGVERDGNGDIHIACTKADKFEIPPSLAKEIRSSIFMLGPIVSRFGAAKVAYPGGCEIGMRPIDLHLKGLKSLGVSIKEEYGYIICDGGNMRGADVLLDYPSVGATENIMMAAVLTKGNTAIRNAAREPEIIDLQNFINAMGGKVRGAGTQTIEIEGVGELGAVEYTALPDRIIAGTYIVACAMAGGKIRLINVIPENIYALISKLKESYINIDCGERELTVECNRRPLSSQIVETLPYPGFPTDLQAQFLSLQCICDGTCLVIENMFETRFKHVPELVKMGANITVRDRMAIVRGVRRLHGAEVNVHDLRGGAALVLAGLAAEGKTRIHNIQHIDRGYDGLDGKLNGLGADIIRI